MPLRFQWDDAKADINWEKHRVSFETARRVFDDPLASDTEDKSGDHGEERRILVGTVGTAVLYVVYTERGDGVIRIISARRALKRERKKYEEGS